MTPEQANARFLGLAVPDMRSMIEARVGPLPASFEGDLTQAIIDAIRAEGVPVPGAAEVLRATVALGLAIRVASNSSRAEMAAKLRSAGLARLLEGRTHSFEDVVATGGRAKPAPDVYLAAAAAEGVTPRECIVLEDSVTGVRAALAAGMECLGFAPHGSGATLREAGVTQVLHALAELPPILRERLT
jgi:HAD superfamily hydrolase (TIGR01509 family)